MGLDFIKKAAPSFSKGMDRNRVELATPKVFTQQPACAPRAYSVRLLGDDDLSVGEAVGVTLRDDKVLMLRGLSVVGVFRDPPESVLHALRESFCEACGRIQELQSLSRTAEVTIC